MIPRALHADDPALPRVLDLIRAAFLPMDGRIDPPGSVHRLTLAALTGHAAQGDLWGIGAPPDAALIATPQADHLYIGKLAVDPACRGTGLARALIAAAEARARTLGLPVLRLQTRIELVENHAIFTALGFVETARTAHPGFSRVTSLTFEKRLAAGEAT